MYAEPVTSVACNQKSLKTGQPVQDHRNNFDVCITLSISSEIAATIRCYIHSSSFRSPFVLQCYILLLCAISHHSLSILSCQLTSIW